MYRALWTSTFGMTAQQTDLDAILKGDNGKKANH
jgi:flagellar basal body rod protein FlgG